MYSLNLTDQWISFCVKIMFIEMSPIPIDKLMLLAVDT